MTRDPYTTMFGPKPCRKCGRDHYPGACPEPKAARASHPAPAVGGEVGESTSGRLIGQLRLQARESLDPEYERFMLDAAAELQRLAAEVEGLRGALEEERGFWPAWALDIKKQLEDLGVEFDPDDEIHLPGALSDWINGFQLAAEARATKAEEERDAARDDRDHFRDLLHDIVQLQSEHWALNGGGPGWADRWEKAFRRAEEPFQP